MTHVNFTPTREVPMFWNRITITMAFGKAAIAGAGVGMAALGFFDAALATSLTDWWQSIDYIHTIDVAATIGAVGGIIVKLVFKV